MKHNTPQRVVFIIDSLAKAGTQLQAAMLAAELSGRAVKVTVLLLEHDESLPLPKIAGVDIRSTPVGPLNRFGVVGDLNKLTSVLRRLRPQVVQTFLFKANLIGALAARLAGIQVVVASRRSMGYDLNRRQALLSRLANRLSDGVVANAGCILAASKHIEGAELPIPVVIPNGVNSGPQVSPSETSRNPQIGILANLRPVKGHDVALKAFARVLKVQPEAKLHLMGDRLGDQLWSTKLVALAEKLEVSRSLVWHSPDTPVDRFFDGIDLLVCSSHSEGLSNAILEGMAAGLPVVATDVGGNREALKDTGILVPQSDPVVMAQAILFLCADSKSRSTLGEAARVRALKQFSPQQLVERHLDYYSWLLETSPDRFPGLPWLRPRRSVALAIDTLDTGGTEQQLIQWSRGLRGIGIPVQIICLRSGGRIADKLKDDGFPIHVLHKKWRFDPAFLLRQQLLLWKLKPRTVLALLTTAGIWTVPAARLAAVPRVLFSMRAMALTDNPHDEGPVGLLTRTLSFSHRVIGNSSEVLDFCRGRLQIPRLKTTLLPNAISGCHLRQTSRTELRNNLDLPENKPLFGIVARLVPVKDHDLFLDVCQKVIAQIPDAQAVIAGDGPLHAELAIAIKQRGLGDNVRLLGYRNDTLELIRSMNALVLTSKSEGSPNAVLEAMIVGTPVVSVDVGDVASMIGTQFGQTVSDRDPLALADALIPYLRGVATSPGHLPEAIQQHDPEKVMSRLRELIAGPASLRINTNAGSVK